MEDTKNNEAKDYILYIPGGVLWGMHPLVVLKFLENITQLPLTKQFNLFAGSSTGAIILGGLNIPKSKNEAEARYSANDILEFYKTLGPKIFPPRRGYYVRQLVMDLLQLGYHFVSNLTAIAYTKFDQWLNRGINFVGRKWHSTSSAASPYIEKEIRPFGYLYKHVIRPLDVLFGHGVTLLVTRSRYDIKNLIQSLSGQYQFEDTKAPATLGDTVISHHVTSMNVTENSPAIFFHHKDRTGKTTHLSHKNMRMDDLTPASCAAQTIFSSHLANDGNHYTDIAQFDTPQTLINSLMNRSGNASNKKLVIIGTGVRAEQIDVQRLNSMLFLQQLIGSMGSYLFGISQRFLMMRDLMGLRQLLGDENVVVIDKSISKDSLRKAVRHNRKMVRTAKRHFNQDLIARTKTSHLSRTPSPDMFDSTPENMEKMEKFGWDMVWENIDTLVPLAKELVENARVMGNVTTERANEIINNIDTIYPPNKPKVENTPTLETIETKKEAGVLNTLKNIFDFTQTPPTPQNQNEKPAPNNKQKPPSCASEGPR